MSPYKPRESGLLRGGGGSTRPRSKRHKGTLKNGIKDCKLSDRWTLRQAVPNFDPALEFKYSQRELILLAEKILDADPKPAKEHPAILFMDRLLERRKREIYVASGVPDPSVVRGSFNRTHPNGRKLRTGKGEGFYR